MQRRSQDIAIGCLTALLVTLIVNAPLWTSVITGKESGHTVVAIESSEEQFYLSRIKETADGYPWAGQPFAYELREQWLPSGSLTEMAMGALVRSGLSIKTASILGDFFGPFVLALILWFAAAGLLARREWRIAFIAVVFGGTWLTFWKRPVHPQTSFILPLAYMLLALSPSRSTLRTSAVRSGLTGLMLYSYPYHWTYCLAAEGSLALIDMWQATNWNLRLKRLAAFIAPFGIIAVPWIILTKPMLATVEYKEAAWRQGLLSTHWPAAPVYQIKLLLAALAVGFTAMRKRVGTQVIPLAALIAAGFAVCNQTILTGAEIAFSSHYGPLIRIVIILCVLWLASVWMAGGWLRRAVLTLLAAWLVAGTVMTTRGEFSILEAARPNRERAEQLLAQIGDLPGQAVILAPLDIADLIPVYTDDYPLLAGASFSQPMTDDDLFTRARVHKAFIDEPMPWSMLVGFWPLHKQLQDRQRCMIKKIVGQECAVPSLDSYLPSRWADLQKDGPLDPTMIIRELHAHRVTYLLVETMPDWMPEMKPLRPVGKYTLYTWSASETQ